MSDLTASSPASAGVVRAAADEEARAILLNKVSWGAIFAGVVVGTVLPDMRAAI